jgi:hypothetical protein
LAITLTFEPLGLEHLGRLEGLFTAPLLVVGLGALI